MSARPSFYPATLPAALVLCATLLLTPAGAVAAPFAQEGWQLASLGIHLRQSKASSAAEAAAIAKRRYGGKILKVEAITTGEGVRYRVKILLDDGRVKTVII